ncbi:hypothetical protein [Promicromonospora sp. NPDC090134]|uniref:hypothetical protein n=1 Tax=Promicromonospora sp. NPDC090134 TaxID=3364408 RepID=UPI00380A9676
MDDKLKIAAVLLAGYLLGRTKRMKLALAAAGALAVRELRSNPDVLKAGTSVLASPAVKKLTDELSGRLVEAGKTAVVAAAAKRVDGLVSNLEKRTGSPLAPPGAEKDDADEPGESPEPTEEPADEGVDEDLPAEEPEEEPPGEEEESSGDKKAAQKAPTRQRRSESSKTSRSSRASGEGGSRQTTSGGRGKKSAGTTSTRKSTGGSSTRKPSSR